MLAVSPLRNITSTKDENQGKMESYSTIGNEEFPDFSNGNVLESINFDDLFVGINDGDVLPDLEIDPEILAEFSISGCGEESLSSWTVKDDQRKEEEDKVSGSGSGLDSSLSTRGEEIVSKRDESVVVKPVPKHGEKGRKLSIQGKNNQGKRKVKVKLGVSFILARVKHKVRLLGFVRLLNCFN